jgi:NAD-dependent deacetylase
LSKGDFSNMSPSYRHPVAFTGAGISAASGLPTFKATWRGRPVRDFLSRDFIQRQPDVFYQFFWEAVASWPQAQPNPAHLWLAKTGIPIVTQNIDGLHQKAGSQVVYEIHGHLRSLKCTGCSFTRPLDPNIESNIPICPHCTRILSPEVVLFGDELRDWEASVQLMGLADLVLVVGCSLEVAPACYLPEMARAHGAEIQVINERAEEELPRWIKENLL